MNIKEALDADRAYLLAQKSAARPARTPQDVPEECACQETLGMIGEETYIRCGRRAVLVLQHRGRDEGPYRMCFEHADHNLRNRNAGVVEWLDKSLEEELKGRYRPL